MTEKAMDLLMWHRNLYGGSVNRNRAATDKWAAAHRWVITGAPAALYLRRVLPHLRLKAEQAGIGIRLEDALTQNNRKWDDALRAEGRVCWELVKGLNRKGPSESAPPGWFARLVGGQWLTSQRSLLTSHGSEPFSDRWPKQGLMRNGHVFRHQLWAPATAAIGGGALPTPVAQTGKGGPKGLDGGAGARQMLADAGFPRAAGAPTPLPTPRANSAMTCDVRGQASKPNPNLETVMGQLLTPCASDWKGRTNWQSAGRNGPQRLPDSLQSGAGTHLNPSFVEEMMGFPVGWTA